MNSESQSNNFFLITVLSFVLVAVFAIAVLTAWAINRPVEIASAAPAPTPAEVADSSSPLPTPAPTITPTTTAPIATPPAEQPADEESTSPTELLLHTVREGDTLGAIAQAYGVSTQALVAANDLADPNLLHVGWTLVIPGGDAITATAPISTAQQLAPTPIPAPASSETINEQRWIDVDLTEQLLTAYEGDTPVHSYLVSTGLATTLTPVGQFRIWIKLRYDDMVVADYYIEDVPFVMYFYQGYGLHGVTWHGNFGHPMSHGCVNQPNDEAEWLFAFADVGTLVNIHD